MMITAEFTAHGACALHPAVSSTHRVVVYRVFSPWPLETKGATPPLTFVFLANHALDVARDGEHEEQQHQRVDAVPDRGL